LTGVKDAAYRAGRRTPPGSESALDAAAARQSAIPRDLLELPLGSARGAAAQARATPDPRALRDANKIQNCRGDMLAAVRRIYAHGIDVLAGFIIGCAAKEDWSRACRTATTPGWAPTSFRSI